MIYPERGVSRISHPQDQPAEKKHGIGRVAIVDWDVHHGNGTQEIFYEDDSVFRQNDES